MAVRFKIRGKLVLSFGAVMILVLSGLGYITYLTFADSIHSHKEEIASLKLEAVGLRVNHSITRTESAFRNVALELVSKGKALAELESGPFTSLGLLGENRQWLDLDGRPEAVDNLRSIQSGNTSLSEGVFFDSTSVIYVSPPIKTAEYGTASLIASAPYSVIFDPLFKQATTDNADILITRGGKLLNPRANKQAHHQLLMDQLTDQSYALELTKEGDVYVMRKHSPILDINIWYVLGEEVYLESIIELKNRIIAATIIILWVSIWIVLIVAYRIARPIRKLTDATKDMQAAEYSVPLEYKETGDEVSDLGSRFEEMRLHIEGLISRDPLSGLFNRRYLMHALYIEVSKAKRGYQPLCCLMMDLDHFKRVNDTYGHQCGDQVIKSTAKIIQQNLRNYDICARYGGEEFVVVLPMTTINEAKEVAERIRRAIEDSPVEWEGEKVSATVSIGMSQYQPSDDENDNGESMISVADEALYLAKGAGRNCVVDGSAIVNIVE